MMTALPPETGDCGGGGYWSLLFKLGYLITGREVEARGNPYVDFVSRAWRRSQAGGYSIYHDPELPVHRHDSRDVSVVVLGPVLDPFDASGDQASIVRRMHSLYTASGERFFDYIDTLSGRFAVLVTSSVRSFVLQDAAGTRTVFYDTAAEDVVVSSHASLIAELQGYAMAPYAWDLIGRKDYQAGIRHFPGALTPYPGVMMLTPNTLLDLGDLA